MLLRFQVVRSRGDYTAVLVDWEWRRWELGARRQIIGNVLPFLFGVGSNSATAPHGRIIVKRAFALELFAERRGVAIEESKQKWEYIADYLPPRASLVYTSDAADDGS